MFKLKFITRIGCMTCFVMALTTHASWLGATNISEGFQLTGVSNVASGNQNPNEWQLKVNKRNYQLFERPFPGSEFLQTKAVIEIPHPKSKVMAAMPKNEGCWKWIERCKKSLILKEINADETITYTALNMPWPLSDRDLLFYARETSSTKDGINKTTLHLTAPSQSQLNEVDLSQIAKSAKKHQRASGTLTYEVQLVDAHTTKMTIVMHTEFGGSAPVGLINGKLLDELEADVLNLLELLK